MEVRDKKNKANDELIKKIKAKFGTVARYIKDSGLSESSIRTNLYRSTPGAVAVQEEIEKELETLEAPSGYRITKKDRTNVKGAIYSQYKNVKDFTEKNPGFSGAYISYLISGDIKFKRGKAKEVFNILNLK